MTTISPSVRPLRISTYPANGSPATTSRRVKVLSPVLTKTTGSSLVVLDRGFGHGDGGPFARGRDRRVDVHPRLELAGRIGDLDPALDRPGRGFDDVADEGEPAAELLAGIGLGLQHDVGPRLHRGEVLLLDVEAGPERRRVGQPEEARSELDGVAGDDPAFEDGAGKRRPHGEQRLGHGLGVEGLDLGGRDAQKHEAFPGPGQEGPGRSFLARLAGQAPGPGRRLDVFGLNGQVVRAVDLGQELAFADAVALDGEDALETARGPGREMDDAARVPFELARGCWSAARRTAWPRLPS